MYALATTVCFYPTLHRGRRIALLPRPESLCDGDVEASYETNANSKGSGDKKKHWWTDRKLKSEEEEWETEHEKNRIQKRTRKLRSSLSLPVDIGYSRLARAFEDKKKKKEPRET